MYVKNESFQLSPIRMQNMNMHIVWFIHCIVYTYNSRIPDNYKLLPCDRKKKNIALIISLSIQLCVEIEV